MFIDREPERMNTVLVPMCQLSQNKIYEACLWRRSQKTTREHCTPKGVPEFFLILRIHKHVSGVKLQSNINHQAPGPSLST
jgi:hypothetical protein